jgi:hypothetical protein
MRPAALLLFLISTVPPGWATESTPVPVTPDNFNRAESDLTFRTIVRDGGLGKFVHLREPAPIEFPVVRPNRDTLYSMAVFDLDAGPVTVTLPESGTRFMSLQVIDEDQFTPYVTYDAGPHTFAREKIGTRYIAIGVRLLFDPTNDEDVKRVHAMQDAIKVVQRGPGRLEVPEFDRASQNKVRAALLALGETLPDTKHMFGARGRVDPVRHLLGTAILFGGNPEKDALYLNVTPEKNNGVAVYRLAVKDVPVDGFWSISVYNAEGHFVKNDLGAYSLNNITARKNADGSVAMQFGGCDGKVPNCLPIMQGWNYMVRLYRPRPEILAGRWTFPEAQAAH